MYGYLWNIIKLTILTIPNNSLYINYIDISIILKRVYKPFSKTICTVDFIDVVRLPTFSVVIIDMLMEGTLSQILYIGPSLCFMRLQK